MQASQTKSKMSSMVPPAAVTGRWNIVGKTFRIDDAVMRERLLNWRCKTSLRQEEKPKRT